MEGEFDYDWVLVYLPTVVVTVKVHFNCPTLDGVEMETRTFAITQVLNINCKILRANFFDIIFCFNDNSDNVFHVY